MPRLSPVSEHPHQKRPVSLTSSRPLDRVTVLRQLVYGDEGFDPQAHGEKTRTATIVLRGATSNHLDDLERAIDDGVNVIKARYNIWNSHARLHHVQQTGQKQVVPKHSRHVSQGASLVQIPPFQFSPVPSLEIPPPDTVPPVPWHHVKRFQYHIILRPMDRRCA